MLLLDVGNTNIACAYSLNFKIRDYFSLSKKSYKDDLVDLIRERKVKTMLVSSVVPSISRALASLCRKHDVTYYECGKNLDIPVKNLYKNPDEVGQDRLLNVYAINKLYGNKNVRLVIDLGTALTFDFINARGAYNGGLIFPGMRIALDGLLKTCALLPNDLELKPTRTLYAKTTLEGINNGIDYGYSFLIAGMIDYHKNKKGDFTTLVTGGGAKLLIKNICKFDYYDDKLALKGLNELSKEI